MTQAAIGWIGTGVMGTSMCSHLMNAGHKAYVYNRSKGKALPLIENGAIWCESPAMVAKQCDIVFTIVGYPQDVAEVILGQNGVIAGAREGAIIVDMTTSEPRLAAEIYEQAKSKGINCLDAPVSGGDIGARQGTLAIMVGGDKETFEKEDEHYSRAPGAYGLQDPDVLGLLHYGHDQCTDYIKTGNEYYQSYYYK